MNIVEKYVDSIIVFAKLLPGAITELVVGWLVINIVIFFLRRAIKIAKVPKDIQGIIITVSKLILWIILAVLLAGTLGLGGLAVAISGSAAVAAFFLSASIGPLLSSIFSGIMLASDHDIKVGMKISTNDGKTVGRIKGIDMRKVRIEDESGLMHVVPNSIVEGTEWIILDRGIKK